MKNKVVPYDISLTLKHLGFNETCYTAYRNEDGEEELLPLGSWINSDTSGYNKDFCSAPLFQDVFDWFIAEHKLEGVVISWTERGKIVWYYSAEPVGEPNRYKCYECASDTKRGAEIACIIKLIEKAKK